MYDSTGQVLGTAAAAVVLPATASAVTGVKYVYFLAGLAAVLVAYNVAVMAARKFQESK